MSQLNIIQFNIRSLKSKFNEFSAYLIQNQIDVALLSETWLTEKDENIYLKNLKNYNYFIKYSKKQGYRGVCILTKKHLNVEEFKFDIQLEKIELIAVKLKDENFYLFSTYIPEENNVFIKNDLEKIELILQNKKFVFGGDVNSYHTIWGSKFNNERGRIVQDFISNNFFHLLNNGENTRMSSRDEGSAIDITFTDYNSSDKFEWKITSESLGSDHLIISIKMQTAKKYNLLKKYVKSVRNQKSIQKNFEELLRENKKLYEIQDSMKVVIKNNTRKVSTKFIPKFWWNEEISSLYKSRKEKISRWRKNNKSEIMREIMNCNKKIKKAIKAEKKKKSNELVSKLNPRSSITEIFQTAKILSGQVINRQSDFNLITENKVNCEKFLNLCFVEEKNPQPVKYEVEKEPIIFIEDLMKSLKRKNNKSTAGADGLTYQMLKNLNYEAIEKFVECLNEMWMNGLNEDNKTIVLKPIPKPNKNIHEIKNYRALSMINTSVKIINETVKNDIENHLKNHRLIPELSFGFRKNYSTIDCLNAVIESVKFFRRKNLYVALISFDCEKAFDSVNAEKLSETMKKLHVKKSHIEWIHNFMTNRKIIVETKEGKVEFRTSTGVPQGDPNSPCMFNIYTINIHKINDKSCLLMQYADDFILIIFHRDKENLHKIIRQKGSEFVKKLTEKKIKVNLDKTAIMLMNQHHDKKSFEIDGNDVSVTEKITFLGIEIDQKLNFSHHCEKMQTDLDRRKNAFASFMRLKDVSHPKTLKLIFDSVIMGYIRYNATIFSNAKKSHRKKIEPKFNICLKKLNGLVPSTPINTMTVIAVNPPLWCEIEKEILNYILRIKLKNISTFKIMQESLKSELKYLEKHKNAKLIVREKDGYMAFEFSSEEKFPELLKFNDYTIVERTYLSYAREIESWPVLKKNTTRNTLTISDVIRGIDNKNSLPSSTIKAIALSSMENLQENKIYTDGSLMPCGSKGVGVYSTRFEISAKLTKCKSSMSVELNGLKIALEELRKNRNNNNVLLTDSQSACTALKNGNRSEENESVIQEILNLMKLTNTKVQWIPAHVGIDGNEKADQLAKNACLGEVNEYMREKNTVKDIKIIIENNIISQWKKWYQKKISENIGAKSFTILKEPSQHHWLDKYKCEFNGSEIKMLNRIISGHDLSPSCKKLFNSEENEICEVCNVKCDSSHLILECKKYKNRVFDTTEKNVIEWIKNANGKQIKSMMEFIKMNEINI